MKEIVYSDEIITMLNQTMRGNGNGIDRDLDADGWKSMMGMMIEQVLKLDGEKDAKKITRKLLSGKASPLEKWAMSELVKRVKSLNFFNGVNIQMEWDGVTFGLLRDERTKALFG